MVNDQGMEFAHYKVVRQLGKRGGFGTVYLARDNKLKRDVAIKVLHPRLAADSGMVKRFIREAQSMGKLNHPNIVIVYSVEDDPRQPYIVMECVNGQTLKDLLKHGAIPIKQALPILAQMAAALDAAHEQGMVHRDVKPANVLIRNDGRVKLTDFGIVKILESQDISLTPAMATVGTSRYMSPEQADIRRQHEIGPASDIYALGIVAYEMLAGHVPFSGKSNALIQDAHRTEPPPDPRSFNSQISIPVARMLMKALAKDPQNRYSTATVFVETLWQVAKNQALVTTADSLPKYSMLEDENTRVSGQGSQHNAPHATSIRTSLPPVPKLLPKPAQKQPSQLLSTFLVVVVFILVGTIVGGAITNVFFGQGTPEPIIVEMVVTNTPEPTASPLPPTAEPPSPTPEPPSPSPTPTSAPSATVTPSALPTETPLPTATLGVGSTIQSERDEMALLYVAEGEFLMGSRVGEGEPDEGPQRTVFLDGFWIDQTEITNDMYAAFLNEEGNQVEGGVNWFEITDEDAYIEEQSGIFLPKEGAAKEPVTEVTWFGAVAYCEWVGRRLPSEAEWEKAARGTEAYIYPWGNDPPQAYRLNFNQDVSVRIEVASLPQGASPYRAFDMAGNVEEWVTDWFAPDYYRRAPNKNPPGPAVGKDRVLRGGSWYDDNYEVRSTYRNKDLPTESVDDRGFRCALSAKE